MFDIEGKINEYLSNTFSSLVKFFIELLKGVVGTLSDNLDIANQYYNIFLACASSLMVCVVLVRIIATMLREADSSTDVTVSNIVMDTLKACVSIPIMLFLEEWLVNDVIIPLCNYIFDTNSDFTADAIKGTTEIAINAKDRVQMTGFVTILFIFFFVIVLGFFFYKCSIFVVNLAFFHMAIPLVAVSIATENMDYSREWWQKLLYSNVTLVSQILCLTIMVYGFTHLSEGLLSFMMVLGGGALVLSPPFIVDSIWTTSGMTRPAMRGLGNMFRSTMMFRRG